MSVPLDAISDVLLPRRYQEEIFVRAQQGNVIAALDTGSGKTYISMLLIKHVAAQTENREKIIVFLVPKVALVQQQGEFIAKQTSLRVRQFFGATAHEMSNRDSWKKEFEAADVFVMTAQIFLNILTHSHWSISKVSLIVFDECHHTRKNHAYNGIMREYFQVPSNQRPKIFGMTASPIWNPKNAAESLATLEKNLDGKVIAVREHVDELVDHSPKPEEVVQEYPAPPNSYPEYPTRNLRLRLDLESVPPELGLHADRILTRYEVTYYNLGPYGAEYFLYSEVKQRVTQLKQEALESAMDILPPDQYAQVAAGGSVASIQEAIHPRLLYLEATLAEFRSFFEPQEGEPPAVVPFDWCSPKVKVLAEVLFRRYTQTFQGIVFVEQRHIARSLATILGRIPLLTNTVKCEQLVGHGAGMPGKTSMKGMGINNQQDTVKMFREKQLNLLIATSVAEEGLDFPACDVVVRFDPVQHMVGYLQSRGRARHKSSTFVIMVLEGAQAQAQRYREFVYSEPHLKKAYQERELIAEAPKDDDDEEDDQPNSQDLAHRERYVVPSTGAILTYGSAMSLINQLCSLIPRDRFTPMHTPRFTGDYISTIHLPSSLPLPPELLSFEGPSRSSKKEAKRAAAFLAVKELHSLGVFDDYLLPAASSRAPETEDSDGIPVMNVSSVLDTMDVDVRDPWIQGSTLWLHVVYVDGVPTSGLVTGTALPPVELVANDLFLSTGEGVEIVLHPHNSWIQRRAMEEYTRMGLWWCITGRGIALPLTCYLVPITRDLKVDFDAIEMANSQPQGSPNWDGIGEEHYGHLLYINTKEFGHPLLLHKLRPDITPSSVPPPGTKEAEYPTYRHYWLHKYTRKDRMPSISTDGPCVEGVVLSRNISCAYSLDNTPLPSRNPPAKFRTVIFPLEFCKWAVMPEPVWQTFFALPKLLHRVTDVYRAREARVALSLPALPDDVLIEALTLPSANAGFNNQRLETFGDAVLKLCAVVHLYTRYPHRHEGQLDKMKRTAIANRMLLARGLERGLEHFLSPEIQSLRVWRYVVGPENPDARFAPHPRRVARRQMARRSIQDCMEAILGASFQVGGIDMALRTGTALGLSFGGPAPWPVRFPEQPPSLVSPLCWELQTKLGYEFKCGKLLLEAVTHPSFRSNDSSSYQRLEFLGDAFLDMVVTEYLYKKFPEATSGQLSWARSRAVCGPTFAFLAVHKLQLHKYILVNNVELSITIGKYIPVLEALSEEEIVHHGWKQDPPKAISDVFESLFGALFVDCRYNYEKAAAIAEVILAELLAVLHPNLPKDPNTEMMIWVAQSGCRCVNFAKSQSRPEARRPDCMSVIVHGVTVAGPLAARNLPMAKGLAAERAQVVLADPESEFYLPRLCTCARKGAAKAARKAAAKAAAEAAKEAEGIEPEQEISEALERVVMGGDEKELPLDMPAKEELDDETEEGFAMLARVVLEEIEGRAPTEDPEEHGSDGGYADDESVTEELEVEHMMNVD